MMRKFFIALILLLSPFMGKAQNVGIKSNLLYDVTANADLGVEFGLSKHWTWDITANYNAWPINDMKWKHWIVMPEWRYWFCDRFGGHFFAFHAVGGQYNVGNIKHFFRTFEDKRYQGWGVGGGIAYGYAWMLAKHWNIEAEIGVGYVFLKYTKYDCATCSREIGPGHYNYLGPTKLSVALEYLF